jgi:hypothetical protein
MNRAPWYALAAGVWVGVVTMLPVLAVAEMVWRAWRQP